MSAGKHRPKGSVAFNSSSFSLGLGSSRYLQSLGTLISIQEQNEKKQLKEKDTADRKSRKESYCKLTDEQVREIRRANEVEHMTPKQILEKYGESYGINSHYLYSLLSYQTRSKVYV